MTISNPLIASNRVEGTRVINADGETIGSIHALMINKHTGTVAYAVMAFGGFLGMGSQYHPLPWSLLDYEPEINGYRVHIDRDSLERGPAYALDEVDRLDTAALDLHYGNPPPGGIVKGMTLADHRGPRLEGSPATPTLSAAPARPGMASPAAEQDQAALSRVATGKEPVLDAPETNGDASSLGRTPR